MFKRYACGPLSLSLSHSRSLTLTLATLCVTSCAAQEESSVASLEASVKPGVNERFLDPALDVSQWLGRFEIESREVYAAREAVLAACQIEPGAAVADIGAGTGFYSRLFATAVGPRGRVYSVEIAPNFLGHINRLSHEEGIENITPVLCSERSTRLPHDSIELALVCDTYHHFEYPQSTLASIYRALKPGGTLVIVDFERIPGISRDWILGHVRAGKRTVTSEILLAGFAFVDEVSIDHFQENYLLRFQKPIH